MGWTEAGGHSPVQLLSVFRAGPGPDGVGGEHNMLGKGGNTEWKCPAGRPLEGPAPGVLLLNSSCPKVALGGCTAGNNSFYSPFHGLFFPVK